MAAPGEVTALLGPNGSGKSTLMRAVAGLIPHSGRITFDGGPRPGDHAVGYMPQDFAVRPVLTVLEVVLLGRIGRIGYRVGEADLAAVAAALGSVGMADHAGRLFGTLSGGQRQLVQLAQVLAREPAVILLDEPTSALDLRNQLELLDLVRRETRRRGLTTVVTIHDLNAALRYADHAVVLTHGRVFAAGTPASVIDAAMIAAVYGVEARLTAAADGFTTVAALRAMPRGTDALRGPP
ncbi:ABC transporter ATP-binding protein [Hyphomicrobiaceae bacterium 22]|uniref:ABC transporter ATP-binding protein n=2 Tax=Prosthecodimorpha staleyi TaxID=2840188 RepID=A0A947D6R4_9HYPH|nr:ABC transporter ATP-binding protein [Prosthecodimorpha staleyi]